MEHEANRLWHDPVVVIYGNLITPGVRCSANAYDLGNRRWYQLNVDSQVTDDDWLSNVVAKHIREHYSAHQAPPPWNAINTTTSGDSVSFEAKPRGRVDRPITEVLKYGHQPGHKLPTTTFDQLKEKTYLSRGADYCLWNGIKCVFKRIEFDVDMQSFAREIKTRETLIDCMGDIDQRDVAHEMSARFKIVPILAVVTQEPGLGQDDNVVGFLMPFEGDSLEMLADRSPDSTVPVTETHLWDLAHGVRELSR
ncbi:hypothetical protein TOPH_03834 [Tolypocladium ophioglossoides CBS 100239]|uniref:Uncharacterized protein n=1 Tax=Tolypocladium ophioglossoides (strain CBS 100239) TaxID=1163406 RepID=A0A0L0NCC3_TOLOC|nr:hypothetical protein TOPH_03834 [Tolypocladium ophioglossoides CBS 100239]